jgi:hypothetical protein
MRQLFMTRSGVLPGALIVLFLAGALAACSSGSGSGSGSPGSAGGLRTLLLHGQPAVSSGPVSPGQPAEFTAYVDNPARDPVTLVSATLIPIAGHPAGHLAALAVSQRRGPIAFATGWPPETPVVPFTGARLGRGHADVVFTMTGARPGTDYMAAGLSIVYRYHGHRYKLRAYSASVACVTRKAAAAPACAAAARQAQQATRKLAAR